MRAACEDRRNALQMTKENRPMNTRLTLLTAALGAALTLFALPVASAPAAEPWWQVLSGSRPTSLWEPEDGLLEIETKKAFVGAPFKEEGTALKLELDGTLIGCLGTANFLGTTACEVATGFPPTTTAAQLEALLEGALGSEELEVTGGPVGAEAFTAAFSGAAPELSVSQTAPPVGSGAVEVVSAGGSGRLVLTLTNLGTAPVDGSSSAVEVLDELPEGVEATLAKGLAGAKGIAGPVACSVQAPDEVLCSFEGVLRPFEAIEIEVLASLTGSPPAAGAPGRVSVSGGAAPPASAAQAVKVSPEPTPFGIEHFSAGAEEEGGDPAVQAGGHPFQFTTTLQLNSGRLLGRTVGEGGGVEQPALPRNLRFPLPAGLAGNVTGMPQCPMANFLSGELPEQCRSETAVGVTSVTFDEPHNLGLMRAAVPVFNLPPAHGEPARFGFMVAGTAVLIDTQLDPDDSYRLVASVSNTTQLAQFLAATTTLWGTPGDPLHDNARGWSCMPISESEKGIPPCERPSGLGEAAFLRAPVQCADPLDFDLELEPWNVPIGSQVVSASHSGDPLVGCNRVPFDPEIDAAPSSKLAESATGLAFSLSMPNAGLLKKDSIAEGQPKRVEVALPEGMTLNPSAAEGLATCSPAEYARERYNSRPGEGCPDASKLGSVTVDSPLIEEQVKGALYQATPQDNPFDSRLALYLIARVPERGILVKLAGRVDTDERTGQIVTTFDDAPQLPFDSFDLHFREGGRAPLVTPPACGDYDIVAKFTPWSAKNPNDPAPNEVVTRKSTFTVQRGVDGGPCPSGGVPSFAPGFEAGSLNNNAGSYSPFYMRLTRRDGEQGLTRFSSVLPKGALAKLAGVTQCPQATVEAAKAKTGLAEKASPSCPASSRIGHTNVGAGVGSVLTYVPGQLYLGGPYNGAPLSVVSITPAVAGPFDVGTVVVQEALSLDPRTGEARVDGAASDPIPHILEGIPLKVRDLRVYVDRPEFTTTPTSCDALATRAELFGSGADVFGSGDDVPVALSARYQAANCANLGFKPGLTISLAAKRSTRGAFPLLRAVLRPRPGDANLDRISVTLPGSELLENAHFRTICTRVQFAAGGGLGGGCPQGAIYGKAKAWTPLLDEPLQGAVYLRSSDNQLPDMVLALKGLVGVEAVGRIDSIGGRIRTTFEGLPDAPITRVELDMQGGKKGLLVNSTDICRGVHRAKADFTGQNGKRRKDGFRVTANCKGRRR
jgi:hypothetical protein